VEQKNNPQGEWKNYRNESGTSSSEPAAGHYRAKKQKEERVWKEALQQHGSCEGDRDVEQGNSVASQEGSNFDGGHDYPSKPAGVYTAGANIKQQARR